MQHKEQSVERCLVMPRFNGDLLICKRLFQGNARHLKKLFFSGYSAKKFRRLTILQQNIKGLALSSDCKCAAPGQTAGHALTACFPHVELDSCRNDLSISHFLSRLFEILCYFRGEDLFFLENTLISGTK